MQVKDLRLERNKFSDSLEQLQSQHKQLETQHNVLISSSKSEIDLLTSRLKEVEADRNRLKTFERRSQGLSIELEEERRKAALGRSQDVEGETDDALRKELKREPIVVLC